MEYRRFGKTQQQVSVFTLGTMRFLKGWEEPCDYLPEDSLENTHTVLNTALSAGINLIETARGYGKSERLIGATLPNLPFKRSDYLIMTKAPPTQSAGEMRSHVEQSLTRLGISRLDLFALHGLNNEALCQLSLKKDGPLSALEQMRSEGLIGSIGFSSHAPRPLLLRMLASQRFDFVNLHYYLFKTANRAAIDLAESLDMGVLIISPNDKGGRLYEPSASLSALTAPLHPANFNERWILANPQIHTLSIGLSEAAHMDIHLQSLNKKPFWGETERIAWAKLQHAYQGSILDRCGDCSRCLPCHMDIDIPEVLRLHHLNQTLDMDHYGKYRYGLMTPGSHWIPGAKGNTCDKCGDCLPRCPQQIPIPDQLFQAHNALKVR
ncbi:MAG: aldo/keto reductase [Magnetococcales bacterium]|nr:aldo/keto reductase [Magnetococcales bacterium]